MSASAPQREPPSVPRSPEPRAIRARCHCGAVEISAFLPHGTEAAGRCDCSICRRRGPGAITARTDSLRVLKGRRALRCYSFHSHVAKHWFCRHCGIYVYHQRRSDPAECGINIGCIEGIDPREFADLPWTDGINHPKDR